MTKTMTRRFKVTAFDPKPLVWWNSRRAKIDMNPPYQRRGRLWSSTDKAYLIDSIINEFDIPKIYMADFTWADSILNNSNLPYAIIDGKQRFEAIFDFFDGHVVLNDDFRYLEDESLKLGGLGYQDLKKQYPHIAEVFETASLTVMGVVSDDVDLINELFVRLNRSKPLTGAEIRNALSGPASELIRSVSTHEFFSQNIKFATNRGQGLNAVAKVLLFEYRGRLAETKKRNLDDFVRDTRTGNSKGELELAGRRCIDVLDDMSKIFLPKDRLLGAAGIVPVYYWFVRQTSEREYRFLREFLVRFEELRAANRRLYSENPRNKKIAADLVEYDVYNRSTNDAKSHQERVNILVMRFQAYLTNRVRNDG
ncbi:MAG: DUF262 domain-containing protein [Acidobacteria bacterium]|nr:DUF262 domain-containing protein [Acidobacteriota bacterium]